MLSNSVRRSSRLSRSLLSRCDSTWTKPQLASELPAPGDARSRVVTCLPGDGVGPEVVRAAQQAVAATGACYLSVSIFHVSCASRQKWELLGSDFPCLGLRRAH